MDLIMPDPGTLVWTAVIFFVLLWALNKFAWPNILGALKEREEGIEENIRKAEEARLSAETRAAELEDRLEKARQEANAIIEEGRADAERLQQEFLKAQQKEADLIRSRVAREIALAKEKAVEEIRESSIQLSFELSRKVIEQAVDPGKHIELINQFVTEFENKA